MVWMQESYHRSVNYNCRVSVVLRKTVCDHVLQSLQPITSLLNWQTTNNITRSSTNQDRDQRLITSTGNSQFTWPWWWLPLRLSKRQSMFISFFIYLFILLRLGVTYIKNIEDNYKTRQGHHNSKNQLLWAQKCHHKPSFSGLHSPGRSEFTDLCYFFVKLGEKLAKLCQKTTEKNPIMSEARRYFP